MPTIEVKEDQLEVDWSDHIVNNKEDFARFLKDKDAFLCPLSQKAVTGALLLHCDRGALYCYNRDAVKDYVENLKGAFFQKAFACISATIADKKMMGHDQDMKGFSASIMGLMQTGKSGKIAHVLNICCPRNQAIKLAELEVSAIFMKHDNSQDLHLLKMAIQDKLSSTNRTEDVHVIQTQMQELTEAFSLNYRHYACAFKKI